MSSPAETRTPAKSGYVRSAHPVTAYPLSPPRVHVGYLARRSNRSAAINQPVVTSSPLLGFAERSFDIALALGLTAVFSPVIVTAAIALGLSEGPVLFSQPRLGRGGREFPVYKFRTMVPNGKPASSSRTIPESRRSAASCARPALMNCRSSGTSSRAI
nr:sugar transferase [Nevskia sp.]